MQRSIKDVWRALYAEELTGDKPQVRVRCPFHYDEHPSCDVHLEKNTFICRSCGAAGGVYDLIKRECNISGDSVVAWLKAHI